MIIKFDIPTDDFDVLEGNIDYILSLFPSFKIISASLMVRNDDSEAEYTDGAGQFDWKEAVFEMDNMNNFWHLAKMIQILKMQQR